MPKTNQPGATDRPRVDADIVYAGFGPAFVMRSQIATSNAQSFVPQGLALYDASAFKAAIRDLEARKAEHWSKGSFVTDQVAIDRPAHGREDRLRKAQPGFRFEVTNCDLKKATALSTGLCAI